MTTAIGSLDLNAFSDLYSDSNQYFWFEGNASATYGAGVHITLSPDTSFIANPTGQNILMNTDGISIRNGLLPIMTLDNDSLDFNVIDTNTNTYTNISSFGLNTRIGQNEAGYAKILLSPEVFTFVSAESTNVFSTGVASNETAKSAVVISVDWDSSITTGLQLGSYTLAPSASTTVGGTFYSSVLANLDNGTRFDFKIEVYINNASFTSEIFLCTLYGTDGFTKGTSQTLTNSGYHGLNTALYYDGVGTLTLSGTLTNYNQVTWNISKNEVVGGQTEPISTNIYNTDIGGNVFMNLSNGAVYIGLSSKDEQSTSDYSLYQAINTLGWNDEVLVGLTLEFHTMTINTSATIVNDVIGVTFHPTTATMTITSSDTSVIRGGTLVTLSTGNYVVLDYASNGVATVTASITVGGTIYADSCVVTVTS